VRLAWAGGFALSGAGASGGGLRVDPAVGANGLRVYDVPPGWLLDLAEEHGLNLLVDIPWPKDRCFLDDRQLRRESEEAVRQAVRACGRHPAVFAFSVANEIPADVVRWSGARRVAAWLERLIEIGRAIDSGPLYTYASFPPTEFLHPRTRTLSVSTCSFTNAGPSSNTWRGCSCTPRANRWCWVSTGRTV
jgi:hypothetical protein